MQWQDEGDEVVTWEDVELVKEQFPEFHLDYKVDDGLVLLDI